STTSPTTSTTSPTTSTTSPTTSTTSPTTSTTSPTTSTSSTTTATSSTTSTTSPTTSTSSTTTATSSTTTTTIMSVGGAVHAFVLRRAPGSSGDTRAGSNPVIKSLTCAGLSIGAGASLIPEGPTPDGSQSRFSLSCTGASCDIGPTSTAPAVNSADPDCTTTGCDFGTPLPIPNPTIPAITSC